MTACIVRGAGPDGMDAICTLIQIDHTAWAIVDDGRLRILVAKAQIVRRRGNGGRS